ncbi:hypothetical protein HNR46_002730 [Haloferula luteola]|uniref:Uncharacterized protein n=1 Tax=Haloferula luteola TaxID=595692 RepID=A0A840VAA6_9BACT|nr:hypothetical protein [Haloferula luteola]MBB5352484.1 hypothetical protein [Haloferula luteola]
MSEETLPPKKKGSCLLIGLITLLVVGIAGAAIWWWSNRPIQPVNLSATERQQVEEKIEAIQGGEVPAAGRVDPTYEKGVREIVLTEKELNGLLHQNTSLGDKLKFELVKDAVHARLETDLDPDLPLVGGKRLKARARFLITQDESGPHFVIDDVTVWGISLPNDWLAGWKGRDLVGESIGQGPSGERRGLAGVESMQVRSGEICIQLKE